MRKFATAQLKNRKKNKKGMAIMGISDKELQKFYEKIADDPVVDMETPSIDYDVTPPQSRQLDNIAKS